MLLQKAQEEYERLNQEFKTLTIKIQSIYEQRCYVSHNTLLNLEKELSQCLTKLSSISSAKAEAEKFLLMILTSAHSEASLTVGVIKK